MPGVLQPGQWFQTIAKGRQAIAIAPSFYRASEACFQLERPSQLREVNTGPADSFQMKRRRSVRVGPSLTIVSPAMSCCGSYKASSLANSLFAQRSLHDPAKLVPKDATFDLIGVVKFCPKPLNDLLHIVISA